MSDPRPIRPVALVAEPKPRPLEERSDEELLELAAGDHRPAFEALAARHLRALTSYCAKFVGDARAGEEVALDVLVQLWRQRPQAIARSFRVLLFTVARSRCLNRIRDDGRRSRWSGRARGTELVPLAPLAADCPDALDALLDQERARRTLAAVQALRPKLREALLLRFDQGLDHAEIARVVGSSESTVRSRVFHALRRLRVALAEATGS